VFHRFSYDYNLGYVDDKEKLIKELTSWLGAERLVYGPILSLIQKQKLACDQTIKNLHS